VNPYTWKRTCYVRLDPCTQAAIEAPCPTPVWFWLGAGVLGLFAIFKGAK